MLLDGILACGSSRSQVKIYVTHQYNRYTCPKRRFRVVLDRGHILESCAMLGYLVFVRVRRRSRFERRRLLV